MPDRKGIALLHARGRWATGSNNRQALNAAGLSVTLYTSGAIAANVLNQHDAFIVAMARLSYSQSEKDAITGLVNGGAGSKWVSSATFRRRCYCECPDLRRLSFLRKQASI